MHLTPMEPVEKISFWGRSRQYLRDCWREFTLGLKGVSTSPKKITETGTTPDVEPAKPEVEPAEPEIKPKVPSPQPFSGGKFTQRVVLIIGVLAGLVIWLVLPEISARRAIREVLRSDGEITVSMKKPLEGMHWDSSEVFNDAASRRDRIDLSGCPQDFQLAYKNYVGACVEVARVQKSYQGWNGFVKGYLMPGISIAKGMSEQEAAEKRLDSSWQALQESSIRHGVPF